MPSNLQLNGAQSSKPTRFTPIYTGRWSSGIWTNRSPLRDANTTRLVEKFYGPAGDALIAGGNVEITNRLTLARRPGTTIFDDNGWQNVLSFSEFHLVGSGVEQINIIIDTINYFWSLYNGVRTLILAKSVGAGQTYSQYVGNTLYYGNGVDQGKWYQTVNKWTAHKVWPNIITTFIIDTNDAIQQLYTAGTSGASMPVWNTVTPSIGNQFQGGFTTDGTAVWVNRGSISQIKNWGLVGPDVNNQNPIVPVPSASGSLTTSNGGWSYTIALVNSLDVTYSNADYPSAYTGNFTNKSYVNIPFGSGIYPNSGVNIDPQADSVAIFRTTDGGANYYLIPSNNPDLPYATVSLHNYLNTGYHDTTTDQALNTQIQAPLAGENTPPMLGAINLTYHLNRIFYSIGNIVYWTTGPDVPEGNGLSGVLPTNFQTFPSLVTRIVPTGIGALVFTESDAYIITGTGTVSDPLQSGSPYLPNIGLVSYNALALDGSIIGLYTADKQFLILDASVGTVTAGFPIGDQLRLHNETVIGQDWDASQVYVTAYTNGEDHAFYVGDGENGWYRLMPTPAPETGYTWSPFAQIVGGCGAMAQIEVLPGQHRLLIAPPIYDADDEDFLSPEPLSPEPIGPILQRDYTGLVFTDNGQSYNAYAVIGSAVLCQPGQIAEVSFITTDSVRVGYPLSLGVILDEALPYYTGPFDLLTNWVTDPPDLKLTPSASLFNQRFYLADDPELVAVCRHLQIAVYFGIQNIQNELLSLTVFGAQEQEI